MFLIFLYLIILFIRPQDWQGSPFYGLPLNDIILIAALVYAFIRRASLSRDINVPHNNLIWAFLTITFLSNAVNGNIALGFDQITVYLKRIVVYIVFLLLLDSPKKIQQALFFSMILAVILSFQGIYQSIHGVGWAQQILHSMSRKLVGDPKLQFEWLGHRTFWIGTWDGPNVLCIVYLMAVPYCLVNFLNRNKSFLLRIFNGVCFFLLSYGIYLTNSRGGFVVFGFVILAVLLLRFGLKKGVIAALILLPMFFFLQPSRMSMLTTEESSAHERTWLWEQGLNILNENRLFGIGKGEFAQSSGSGVVAHNNYVSAMAETGFLGLLVYLALIYMSIKSTFIVYQKTIENKKKDLLHPLSMIICTASAGFFFVTFFVLMEQDILFIYFALCASLYLAAQNKKIVSPLKINAKDWSLICLSALSMIILIWLIAEKEIFG